MKNPIELVIFDCDGVLVDSEGISARVLIGALAAAGIQVDLAYFTENFLGRSFPTVAQLIRKTFEIDLPPSFEEGYRAELLTAFADELGPTDGIAAVLSALTVRACVATSSRAVRARRSLALTGLMHHFEGAIFTASEVANGKPAPDLFLYAASRMGVHPQNCLVIEDSLPGVIAAQAAGMPVIRYIGGSHLFGIGVDASAVDPPVQVLTAWSDLFRQVPELYAGKK